MKMIPLSFTMLKTINTNATHAPLGNPSTPDNYADNLLSPYSTPFTHHLTINTALGANPASLRVNPRSAPPENVFFG